jgi:hypothetical protein
LCSGAVHLTYGVHAMRRPWEIERASTDADAHQNRQ